MSINISAKTPRERMVGRPCRLSSVHTKWRKKRQEEGPQVLFINEDYLAYDKISHGMWQINVNRWNEGK